MDEMNLPGSPLAPRLVYPKIEEQTGLSSTYKQLFDTEIVKSEVGWLFPYY
jgi:hypothetical protein